MRFLAFILSIYILTLNLTPCEDTSILDNEVKIEISKTIGDDHQHQGADSCSPFCSCQCCHIHATHFEIVELAVSSTDISTEVFYHFNGLVKDFNTTILQPPQV